jgi:uracil-DNA glycosylase
MIDRIDQPKLLGEESALNKRLDQIYDGHINPLNRFVESMRNKMGPEAAIPYFDPWDGGVNAELLMLLEAPGPKAVNSGFVSRNNPDETAKNIFELSREAGIERTKTVVWNIVPWYIGSGKRIRAANSIDIGSGLLALEELFSLLPSLKLVMLLGKKAQKASDIICGLNPSLNIVKSPHPSPLFVNRRPENRELLLGIFKDVSAKLSDSPARK